MLRTRLLRRKLNHLGTWGQRKWPKSADTKLLIARVMSQAVTVVKYWVKCVVHLTRGWCKCSGFTEDSRCPLITTLWLHQCQEKVKQLPKERCNSFEKCMSLIMSNKKLKRTKRQLIPTLAKTPDADNFGSSYRIV